MTQYPEAYLARELGMCYAGIALVTDRDAGVDGDPSVEAVTAKSAFEVMAANVKHARRLLAAVIPALPSRSDCDCMSAGAPSLRGRP
jgi:5'-methylthioadenosine phosphorylase